MTSNPKLRISAHLVAGGKYHDFDFARRENIRKSTRKKLKLEENDLDITTTEISMVPKTTLQLDSKASIQTMRLLDSLDEIDDVQKVYSNADYTDEALVQYQSQN